MQLRAPRPIGVVLLTVLLAACSGGGGSGGAPGPNCAGNDPRAFCLTACNLGCSFVGCSINAIAQNQPIFLSFNREVDPRSINSGSISIRTSSGEEPVGKLLVNGSVVQFAPEVRISGAQTFFGFKPNETYTMFLPSGSNEPNVVVSTHGDRLASSVACSLTVSRGVIDLNEACPQATLTVPQNTTAAPVNTVIVLRFNEILDPAPFIGATEKTKPIRYFIKKTTQSGNSFFCRNTSAPTELAGIPRLSVDSARQVSEVTFVPQQEMPGAACVEITVTPRVVDLAGVEACPQTIQFVTEFLGVQEKTVVEDFSDDAKLDKPASAADWGGNTVTFAKIGGDGSLGPFAPDLGTPAGKDTWQWSTESQTIPRTNTLTNAPITVTDGVFNFDSFFLPAGKTVIFTGKNPVQINVRGKIQIDGRLICNGVDIARDAHKGGNTIGEAGGLGGPGGARGGKGGDKGDGVSNKPNFNGQVGEDVELAASHSYANQAKGTGGPGSKQWPADGKQSSVIFTLFQVICAMATTGGSGGGNAVAGKAGSALWTDSNNKPNAALNKEVGPPPLPSKALGWGPTVPSGRKSLEHYRVGGSGGGGAGSHPLASINPSSSGPKISYNSCRAGAGGGGALALRAGREFSMAGTGLVQARGGNASPNLSNAFADQDPAPGGGGAGGTILVQLDEDGSNGTLSGTIDVSGGKGGELIDTPTFGDKITILGGDGSPGVIRMETIGTLDKSRLGNTIPPVANSDVQQLKDVDNFVGMLSLWYATNILFPPDFVRYEIEAKVDGQTVIYSDDPKKGPLAEKGVTPIYFLVQGTKVEIKSGVVQPIENAEIKPWRTHVGPAANKTTLADDGSTGFRYTVVLDRSFGKTVEIKKISVVYRL